MSIIKVNKDLMKVKFHFIIPPFRKKCNEVIEQEGRRLVSHSLVFV